MKYKKIFALLLSVVMISPAFAGKENGKASGKAKAETKIEQKDQRSAERSEAMEQRRADCQNNSEKAECAGWQKGRNKQSPE